MTKLVPEHMVSCTRKDGCQVVRGAHSDWYGISRKRDGSPQATVRDLGRLVRESSMGSTSCGVIRLK